MKRKPQILYLSHGGGPLPLLGDKGHDEMVDCLQNLAGRIKEPSAIIVVSAHWEEDDPTITSSPNPSLMYDYYGFPEAAYQIKYPCPGEPALAGQLHKTLERAGLSARFDKKRGFDHGVFVPLKIMYPKADIPCVQLSLLKSLDPDSHIALGRALQGLGLDGVLVIGSGFSFHNMKAFFAPETPEIKAMNTSFDDWLQETCYSADHDEVERTGRLIHWENGPHARFCHPREEHLLPLHVCYGLAGTGCSERFSLKILNKKSSMFLWSGESE